MPPRRPVAPPIEITCETLPSGALQLCITRTSSAVLPFSPMLGLTLLAVACAVLQSRVFLNAPASSALQFVLPLLPLVLLFAYLSTSASGPSSITESVLVIPALGVQLDSMRQHHTSSRFIALGDIETVALYECLANCKIQPRLALVPSCQSSDLIPLFPLTKPNASSLLYALDQLTSLLPSSDTT
jgi:hypothetical protein